MPDERGQTPVSYTHLDVYKRQTIHKVGAEPELYEIELNDTANDVTEQVIKGDIAIIKHTDDVRP